MKKLLVAGLIGLGSLVMAQTYYSVLPYAGYVDYSGTTSKDKGIVSGIYMSAFESPYKVELDVEHTRIKYRTISYTYYGKNYEYKTPDLNQNDFTAIFHYYQGYNLDYKFGMHYISGKDDELTDKGKIFAAGILYYKTLQYNAGMDVYYSDYSNLSTSPKLWQVTPKVGMNFGNYKSAIGSFYAEAKLDYIRPTTNREENKLKQSYTSGELTLTNYNGPLTTKIGGWIGKRNFAVDNGGFIVNNLKITQKDGAKFSESYKIDKTSNVKVEYSYTRFEDNGNSHSSTYLASYNYSF